MATATKSTAARPAPRARRQTRATAPPRRPATSGAQLPGRLFDGQGPDRDVTVTRALIEKLGDRQTLWVDVAAVGDEISALADLFDLDPQSVEALRNPGGRPRVDVFARYLQVFVNAIEADEHSERAVGVTMIAGPNFVLTVHDGPVEYIVSFLEHLKGDTPIGLVDGTSFLAALLEWHLTGYFRAVEALEIAADELDRRALDPRSDRELLSDLVQLRRRISRVRRELTPHREVFPALTRAELTSLADADVALHFRALVDRLERCIDAVEVARELVLGSFDVNMTRTAQRTNEIMKILTLASVIVLPGSMIAGVMGMNFKVEFFDNPTYFWVVIAAIAGIAVATLAVARIKRWI